MNIFFEKRMLLSLAIVLLGFEASIIFPKNKFFIGIIIMAFFVFALFWILKIKPQEKESLPVFILPILLLLEALFFMDSIINISLRQFFIFLFGALLYLVIFSLESLKQKIESYAVIIHNILTASIYIGTFLGYVLIYNFYLKGITTLSVSMFLSSIITAAFFIFFLWHSEKFTQKTYLNITILSFIETQFFWILSFFPLLALQSGFILFLIFYIFMELFMFDIIGYISFNKALRHATIPVIALILFLFSIKW